mgnify:CR=1 FL=1
MKKTLTLLQTVQRLKREEVVRFASNLGMEINEEWSTAQMRKAYANHVLAHPKELLERLPFQDINILKPSEKDLPGEPLCLINTHVTPIFVIYGLAEMTVISGSEVEIAIPGDFMQAVAPHIGWATDDPNNKGRYEVELMVEGLANLLGFITLPDIKRYLIKLCQDEITEEQAEETIDCLRQQSLLLDSMEWREHGDETKEEDVLFVSRYGWDDRAAMKRFIEQRSASISSPREFSSEELISAAFPSAGLIPNAKSDEFVNHLTLDLLLDETEAKLICFKVWHSKMQAGRDEFADQMMEANFFSFGPMKSERDLSEQQLEESLQRLVDYANNIPLWHLRGFTATEYPLETYVPMKRAKLKGPLGKELKKMKREAQWMIDLMKEKTEDKKADKTEQNPWASEKIGRNDPCPCGSGLKYKKCHGRNK